MPLIQLTGRRTIAIRDALVVAFPDEAAFRPVVIETNRTLDQVSAATFPLPDRVLETIKHAEANNWLLDLLAAARRVNPADPTLKSLYDELKASAPPIGVSPYLMCRLGAGTVMVDRKELRAAVRELGDVDGRRILVITGDSRSGKSHSLQLMTFIAQVQPAGAAFTLIPLDLDPRREDTTPMVITAPDLARRLMTLTGYKIAWPGDLGDKQWSKWVVEFGDEFARCASGEQATRWIVIDSLNKVLLDQSAVDLIHDLAVRVFSTLPWLRLVLVGYHQSLPPLVMPYIQEDKMKRLTVDDLVEFFIQAHKQLGLTHDEDHITDIVSRVASKVDLKRDDYLLRLGPVVAQEFNELRQKANGHG
jgi:hypothetical protein